MNPVVHEESLTLQDFGPVLYHHGKEVNNYQSSDYLRSSITLTVNETNHHMDTADWINYIINVYIDTVLCCFGFVGNFMAIYVLQKEKCKNSNNCLLQALAVYDICMLLFTVFYTILRSVYPATGELDEYYAIGPYIIAIALPLGWIIQTGTIWFTTLVAADRFIAVTYPFKASQICTYKKSLKLIVFVTIIAILFNLPRFFHYYLIAKQIAQSNDTSTFVSHIKMDLNGWNTQIYHYLYHITLTFIFLYIIPLCSLIFLNTRLILALHNAKETQKRMSGVNKGAYRHNRSITLNMVVVITKFILCQTPDFVAAIIGALPIYVQSDAYRIFLTIKEMLLVINSSVNFYIYLIFNSKFRKITQRSCCHCCSRCCKKDNSISNVCLTTTFPPKASMQDVNMTETNIPPLPPPPPPPPPGEPDLPSQCIQKSWLTTVIRDDADSGIFDSRDINMTPDPTRKSL